MPVDLTSIQDRPPNFREDGQLYLVRCFACEPEHGRDNHGLVVATGRCAWCGWSTRLRDPSACRHCGVSQRGHYSRWMPDVGYHQWTEPTWEQRRAAILHNANERKKARRA